MKFEASRSKFLSNMKDIVQGFKTMITKKFVK